MPAVRESLRIKTRACVHGIKSPTCRTVAWAISQGDREARMSFAVCWTRSAAGCSSEGRLGTLALRDLARIPGVGDRWHRRKRSRPR
jgi:hypothetical protein